MSIVWLTFISQCGELNYVAVQAEHTVVPEPPKLLRYLRKIHKYDIMPKIYRQRVGLTRRNTMKTIKYTLNETDCNYQFPQDISKICFFDIETTGLSPKASSLYMIGIMYFNKAENNFEIVQWFADTRISEPQIINTFLEALESFDYLYHFNGKTFDIPYILNKCDKYAIPFTPHTEKLLGDSTGTYSIDILAQIRPLKKSLGISKANQTALEQWLGIFREDKYDGGMLIKDYSEYLQKKLLKPDEAPELEKLLLLHNHDDMAGMLSVVNIMSYKDFFQAPEIFNIFITALDFDEEENLQIHFSHSCKPPKPAIIQKAFPDSKIGLGDDFVLQMKVYLDDSEGILCVPSLKGILKTFFDNYKDYYYIPEADTAVLKSVGEIYDKSIRKRAAASTCYTKKEGIFIPSMTLSPLHTLNASKSTPAQGADIRQFFLAYKDKICFYELPDHKTDEDFFERYLIGQLKCLL